MNNNWVQEWNPVWGAATLPFLTSYLRSSVIPVLVLGPIPQLSPPTPPPRYPHHPLLCHVAVAWSSGKRELVRFWLSVWGPSDEVWYVITAARAILWHGSLETGALTKEAAGRELKL